MESQSFTAFKRYTDRVSRTSKVIIALIGRDKGRSFVFSAMSVEYEGTNLKEVQSYLDEYHEMHGAELQVAARTLLDIPHKDFPANGLEILELAKYEHQVS